MYCTKCGTENEETAKLCRKCGANLENDEVKTGKPNKKIGVFIAAILVIALVAVIWLITGQKKTPDIKQITGDLQEELKKDGDITLYEQDFNIIELTIENEKKEKKSYKVQVYVDYSNDRVECQEKYILSYYKDKEWAINDIEEYDTESWVMKPIYAPSAEELVDECFEFYVRYGQESGVQTFVPLDEQVEPDLENGIARYYYEAISETQFKRISTQVEITYWFNWDYANWKIEGYRCDEENVEYNNLSHTWSGIVKDKWKGDKNIQIEITEIEGQNIKGKLYIDDEVHEMSGTVSGSSIDACGVKMQDVNDERYYVDGIIWDEVGNFDGKVYINYNPDAMFYFESEVYSVDLNMEN